MLFGILSVVSLNYHSESKRKFTNYQKNLENHAGKKMVLKPEKGQMRLTSSVSGELKLTTNDSQSTISSKPKPEEAKNLESWPKLFKWVHYDAEKEKNVLLE
jgi:hypothetical protein